MIIFAIQAGLILVAAGLSVALLMIGIAIAATYLPDPAETGTGYTVPGGEA